MDTHMLLDMLDMPMELTHMPIVSMLTERDLLMLSQRLMLMSMDTHMLLDMLDMPMELTHMPIVSMLTERDLLMLSQRLMPTTVTMPDLTPTDMPDTDMLDTHTVLDISGESKYGYGGYGRVWG